MNASEAQESPHSLAGPRTLAKMDWSSWRSFGWAILSLAGALVLALCSSAAAESGEMWLAGTLALVALAGAGWVAIAIVPVLARRTALRWIGFRTDYRFTREGIAYIGGVFIVALTALNTGNNLLFMILACLLAGIAVSGIFSQMVLSGVELRLELPEHIFAGRPVLALAELINHKQTLPSFSLRLVGASANAKGKTKDKESRKASNGVNNNETAGEILPQPVYFPYLPHRQAAQQNVELLFPRRGIYRQESLGLQTRFPFGFLEKTRRVESQLSAVVYPSVEPTDDFYEILPLVSGELESFLRGRGNDLYSIRDYQSFDSARHVDWKASAKTGHLKVREFAREDERRVLLVLDPTLPEAQHTSKNVAASPATASAAFDRGVALCASLAWHFYEVNSVLGFRAAGFESPMAPAGEVIYDILGYLASASSGPESSQAAATLLDELADSPALFKIILTCQPRGSIPTSLWNSSYILFLNS